LPAFSSLTFVFMSISSSCVLELYGCVEKAYRLTDCCAQPEPTVIAKQSHKSANVMLSGALQRVRSN
jgi:hypothetical protein